MLKYFEADDYLCKTIFGFKNIRLVIKQKIFILRVVGLLNAFSHPLGANRKWQQRLAFDLTRYYKNAAL